MEDANRIIGTMLCCRYTCAKISTVPTEMGAMCLEHSNPLMFQIQLPYQPCSSLSRQFAFVPWEVVKPHERQAQANHYQTLARLSQRGGLSRRELLAVLQDRPFRNEDLNMPDDKLIEALRGLVEVSY